MRGLWRKGDSVWVRLSGYQPSGLESVENLAIAPMNPSGRICKGVPEGVGPGCRLVQVASESRREFKHLAPPLPMVFHPIACGHPQPCSIAAARSTGIQDQVSRQKQLAGRKARRSSVRGQRPRRKGVLARGVEGGGNR